MKSFAVSAAMLLLLSSESAFALLPDDPFLEQYCPNAVAFQETIEVQRYGVESVSFPGLFIELGACYGGTINNIADMAPFHLIYGFDSFEGLPEDWNKGDSMHPKGEWATALPSVRQNVRLIKGLFEDSLPTFVADMGTEEPISFLHVDCDLYSSTACALEVFAPLIVEGTIIVFDEFYNYPTYRDHEYKAFHEFLEAHGWDAEYLAYRKSGEQVCVRIVPRS